MMLPLAMFAAIFYFLILRPNKKKQQQHNDMVASISKGSEVITAGGFFGTVREILDDSYIIEVADGVKVRILKTSISIKKTDGEKPGEPKKVKKKKKKPANGDNAETVGDAAAETTETAAAVAEVNEAGFTEPEVAVIEPVVELEEENNEEKA